MKQHSIVWWHNIFNNKSAIGLNMCLVCSVLKVLKTAHLLGCACTLVTGVSKAAVSYRFGTRQSRAPRARPDVALSVAYYFRPTWRLQCPPGCVVIPSDTGLLGQLLAPVSDREVYLGRACHCPK